ncbi:hypothetical protein EAF04_000252 [Stromatinia cepivora]|nr:hypothetical protein EAF04_000252 [Stromatinia cepivora]
MALASPPKLSQSLLDRANALTAKVNDGQAIFGPVASLLDKYLDSKEVSTLPARSRKLLTALCLDFKASTERHFDALISGSHLPRVNNVTVTPFVNPPAIPQADRPTETAAPKVSYAQKAVILIKPYSTINIKSTLPIVFTDSRLFVRIGHFYPARKAGAFAVLIAFKKAFGPFALLLKEV